MIRKLLSVVAVATIATAPLAAQSKFGVVGGFVSSNITIKGDGASVSFTSRSGFAAGVSMTHNISKDFDFAPELLYIQKGSKLSSGSESGGVKISYVELPLLFRAKFGASSTQPFVMAGPAVGVKASCKVTASGGGVSASADCGGSDGFDMKSVDAGVMVGAGISHNRFSVSVRYDLGLTNIAKGADAGTSAKNRAFLALVGIAL